MYQLLIKASEVSCRTHLILTAWHRFSHWIHWLNSTLTIFSRLHFFHQAFCNVTIKQLVISWLFNEGFGSDVILLFPWSNKPATSMTTEQFRQLYVGVGIRFSHSQSGRYPGFLCAQQWRRSTFTSSLGIPEEGIICPRGANPSSLTTQRSQTDSKASTPAARERQLGIWILRLQEVDKLLLCWWRATYA